MKKIAKLTGNIRLTGHAEKNGVAFQATKFGEDFSLSTSGTLASAQGDQISYHYWNEDTPQSPLHAKINKFSNITYLATSILAILFMFAYFYLAVTQEKMYLILFDLSYLMISAMNFSEGISIFIARILGNKEITSFSKFLAAQHAVQNAYYDTGKVPNIDEVKKYSSYSYYSKHMTSKSAAIGMLWFLMMLLHHLPIPWNFLGILLVLPITVLLGRRNLLFFFQFLVVSKPSDIHYKTALAALETYIDIIDSIKISVTYVSMDELEADLKPDCDSCAGLSESQNNA